MPDATVKRVCTPMVHTCHLHIARRGMDTCPCPQAACGFIPTDRELPTCHIHGLDPAAPHGYRGIHMPDRYNTFTARHWACECPMQNRTGWVRQASSTRFRADAIPFLCTCGVALGPFDIRVQTGATCPRCTRQYDITRRDVWVYIIEQAAA